MNKYSNIHAEVSNSTDILMHEPAYNFTPIQIGTLICFMVGVIQVKFRKYIKMSFNLTRGFNELSAFHVRFSSRNFVISTVRVLSQRIYDSGSDSRFYVAG